MTDILIREDTGEIAIVRVIEPDAPVSAPYSRAVGRLERWVADERHAVDEFAAWIEGQAAQAHAEMRLLCDELGLPVAWAEIPDQPVSVKPTELPDPVVFYVDFNNMARGGLVKTARHHGTEWVTVGQQVRAVDPHETDMAFDATVAEIEGDGRVYLRVHWPEQLAERQATLTALVKHNRPIGWTPRPEDFAPAPDETMPGRPALAPAPEGTYTQPGAVDSTERRSWSAEWAAFWADAKDMWRDLRQSLAWWRKEED
jgi:hypothetical protein